MTDEFSQRIKESREAIDLLDKRKADGTQRTTDSSMGLLHLGKLQGIKEALDAVEKKLNEFFGDYFCSDEHPQCGLCDLRKEISAWKEQINGSE